MAFIQYIPIATTLFSLYFFIVLYKHWLQNRQALHVFWWMLGVFFYGAGTVTESINTIFGYSEVNFKAWYIFGALLGGAPLAQGTVHLLMNKKAARTLSIILTIVIAIAAFLVIFSPLYPVHELHVRLSGRMLEWSFIRWITPFINLYAFCFLVGGAVYSAFLYLDDKTQRNRFWGNLLIALGGLLPGIGGSFTKFGYVEVLYVTEFLGICLIYAGYYIIRNPNSQIPNSQIPMPTGRQANSK